MRITHSIEPSVVLNQTLSPEECQRLFSEASNALTMLEDTPYWASYVATVTEHLGQVLGVPHGNTHEHHDHDHSFENLDVSTETSVTVDGEGEHAGGSA